MTEQRTRIGVVGASGYGGMELVRLILNHPRMALTYLAGSRTRSESFGESYPNLLHLKGPSIVEFDVEACSQSCDLVFIALPSGQSGRIAVSLWEKGMRVIDLSGDLRLGAKEYSAWYGKDLISEEAQQSAVYGLTEFAREAVKDATLVANPGCYATASILALKPLENATFIESGRPVVIDAKSGVTGAGRSAKTQFQFGELADDFYPYKVGAHQHTPEIEQALSHVFSVVLTTQLLPVPRGIEVSAYVPVTAGVSASDVYDLYQACYANEPFVHVLPDGGLPHIKSVRASNLCHIGLHLHERQGLLQVFSTIDNLQKGAAGQALQNANLMLGFDETEGLTASSPWM